MAPRTRFTEFLLGSNPGPEDDNFESDFEEDRDANEELTDIVDLNSISTHVRQRSQPVQASVTSLDRRRQTRSVTSGQIIEVEPTAYAEAAKIGEIYKDGNTVVINAMKMEPSEAQRLIDFLGGLAFANDGKLKAFTPTVFFLVPPSMVFSELDGESLRSLYSRSE